MTFDLALIDRVGCEVWAYDPTPRAIQHVASAATEVRGFHFTPCGLWSDDTVMKWYAPRDPSHVSHSVVNLQGTSDYFEAPCKRLATLMSENGHDRLDLLKIDIEGAEHAVLADIIQSEIRPRIIAVEFDQPWPWRQIRSTVRRLLAVDYVLVHIEGWNYTFVRSHGLPSPVRGIPRWTCG